MDSHVPALHRTVLVTGEGTSSELDSPGNMDLSHCSFFAAVSSWGIAFSASTIASISTERTMSNSQLGILMCREPGCVCMQSGQWRVAPHGTWADLLWSAQAEGCRCFPAPAGISVWLHMAAHGAGHSPAFLSTGVITVIPSVLRGGL